MKTLKNAYIKTTDDFHPNFKYDMVEVELSEIDESHFRILVSGADDTMYEKFFKTKDNALNEYDKVVTSNPLILELKERGYTHF